MNDRDQIPEDELHNKVISFLSDMEDLKGFDEYLIEMHSSFHANAEGCRDKRKRQDYYFYFTQLRDIIKLAKLMHNNGIETE